MMYWKKKKLLDDKYKYWLIEKGQPVTALFPELRNIVPDKFFWGGPVNHHVRCDKHRDDHQVKMMCGWHAWFHTAKGIRWEKEHLKKLIDFAEGEYDRYKRTNI